MLYNLNSDMCQLFSIKLNGGDALQLPIFCYWNHAVAR